MADTYESDPCSAEIFKLLQDQAGADVLMVIIGSLGVWGCGTLIFTYCSFQDFRYKSYFLLGCMAAANFCECYALAALGLLRLVQLTTCSDPRTSPADCACILAFYWAGYTASVAFDFTVAVDRLIYIFKPASYRLNLGLKYTIFMVLCAAFPALCVETPAIIFSIPNATEMTVSVCSECDSRMQTTAHKAIDYANLALVTITASMYLALAFQTKRPFVRNATMVIIRTNSARELNSHLTKFLLMQKRVLRVSVATAISSLLTNGVFLALKLFMESTLTQDELARFAPYYTLALLVNASGSTFFALWRDQVLRKRFICVMRSCYGLKKELLKNPTSSPTYVDNDMLRF